MRSPLDIIGGAGLLIALALAGGIIFFYEGDKTVAFALLTAFVLMFGAQLRSLQASEITDQKVEVVHGIVNSQRTSMEKKIDEQATALNEMKIALAAVQGALVRAQTQSDIKTGTIDNQAAALAAGPVLP